MSSPSSACNPCFMGLDLSTQQLKVIVIDGQQQIVYQDFVSFENHPVLAEKYHVKEGYHEHSDGQRFTSPTLMWVEALDILLERMKLSQSDVFSISNIVAVSGSGQQHGSVYFRTGGQALLAALNPEKALCEQLSAADAFAVANSPIWMDSSTKAQCRGLEEAVGGAETLALATGSRAYPRFTGSQIAKISQTEQDAYGDCDRVCLVSSFLCSLIFGAYAPIDYSDGSGMNLLNIHTRRWFSEALQYCGKDLEQKLGMSTASYVPVGNISSYFVQRYAFSPGCQVFPCTGDNPSSLAGLRIRRGDVAVSLGSSDTVFLWMDEAKPGVRGHVFVNPVDADAYMGMLCYRNGSRTRELIRDDRVQLNGEVEKYPADVIASRWQSEFTDHLLATAPGNGGKLGVYFLCEEIVPLAHCIKRVDANDSTVHEAFDKAAEVRALVEGQFLAKRIHAKSLGYSFGAERRVLATGGASVNQAVLQVLSNVFNAPVYTLDVSESACLGAAYRALHGYKRKANESLCFADALGDPPSLNLVASPDPNATAVYDSLVERYQRLEESAAREFQASA
eukprot:scpid67396/ scgid16907/ Xylulose kinase